MTLLRRRERVSAAARYPQFLCQALLALGIFLAPASAWAWGAKGHAAVASLAEANLRPEVQVQVQALLVDDLDRFGRLSARKTLAAVASWPDEIRSEAVKTDPDAYKGWHVRGNQICSDRLGRCPDGHCVDQLIIHYAKVLGDHTQSHRARNEALKWVVHLVGDLHQPLHSGINPNGGSARAVLEGVEPKPGELLTLHSAWDNELAVAALKGWHSTAVLSPDQPPLQENAPTQWMIETRGVALRDAYSTLPGFQCAGKLSEPIILDEAYQQHSIEVVRQQIERAGLRLAQLLNETLSESATGAGLR
jgi:hypothetical protein